MLANPRLSHQIGLSLPISKKAFPAYLSLFVSVCVSTLFGCFSESSLAEQALTDDPDFLDWYLRYVDDAGEVFDPLDFSNINLLEPSGNPDAIDHQPFPNQSQPPASHYQEGESP